MDTNTRSSGKPFLNFSPNLLGKEKRDLEVFLPLSDYVRWYLLAPNGSAPYLPLLAHCLLYNQI
jgi:hypothetical protein